MKKAVRFLILMLSLFFIIGCNNVTKESETYESNIMSETEKKEQSMKIFINDREISVTFEDNASVKALMEEAKKSDIVINMSKYGGFEQVGPLGKTYVSDDERITTSCGDIVLYDGNNIVMFYGSNTWEYTRLGKINLTEEEIKGLLSSDGVTITIKYC